MCSSDLLVVEQDVSQALAVASRLHCLLEGRIVLAGQPAELTAAQIEIAYFGETARGRGGNGRNGTPVSAAQRATAETGQPAPPGGAQ